MVDPSSSKRYVSIRIRLTVCELIVNR
jgi:hypothetical protein